MFDPSTVPPELRTSNSTCRCPRRARTVYSVSALIVADAVARSVVCQVELNSCSLTLFAAPVVIVTA